MYKENYTFNLRIFVGNKKKKKNKTNKIFKTIRYPTCSKIIYCLYTGEKEWYEKVVGQRSSPSDITFNNVKTALLISKGLILSVVVWRNQRSRHIVASFKVDVCINGRSAHLHTASQAAIHTGQTDRSRSGMEADEQNSMTYIPDAQCVLRAQRAYGEIPKCLATLHIDSKSIRRISMMCQHKGTHPPPPWPSLQLLLVSKPTKRREDRPILASIPCLWKLWAVRGWPSCDWLVCESNISQVSADRYFGELSRRCSSFGYMPWILELYFSGILDRSLINLRDSRFQWF